MPTIVRRATAYDVDAILDLLTEYDLPRAYFEPFYVLDPTYRPEHSWIVEVDGRLAAHLRLYDRWIYLQGVTAHIAGVGNVITAHAYRGRGFASDLLRAFVEDATTAGFMYSLLWTHIPELYQRFGWEPIEQEAICARLPQPTDANDVAEFTDDDLSEVMDLYDRTNGVRTGPTVRSAPYWRAQVAWTHEDRDGFLVARDSGASLVAYVRSRSADSRVEILELGVEKAQTRCGTELMCTAAQRRSGAVRAQLPPSLLDAVPPAHRQMESAPGLMGRTLDVHELFETLEPVLEDRAARAGVDAHLPDGLSEADLGHLLFHGYDPVALERFAGRNDTDVLRTLFPELDFVIWPSDVF